MPSDPRRPANPAGYSTAAGWVSAVLDVARPHGQVPRYGSPEHLALPPSSPLFVAAVAIAAQAWWTDHGTPQAIGDRLRLELTLADDAHEWADAAEHAEAQSVVRQMHNRPSLAELADRRGEPDRAARARAHAAAMRDGWNDAPDGAA